MRTSSPASEPLTRRAVLGATAVVGIAGAAPVALASSAAASTSSGRRATRAPRPSLTSTSSGRGSAPTEAAGTSAGLTGGADRGHGVPDGFTRHVLSRFSCGVNPTRLAEVEAAGGINAWFDEQLQPDQIPDHQADELWQWFPVLALSPYKKWQRYKNGTEQGWEMMQDLASWTMLRRLYTKRQVEALMADFWADVLHVPSPADEAWVYRVEYQKMLRENAFGKFRTLLNLAIAHPAMGLYLNNVESTATAINENLGRELLECHTVGIARQYTQDDVVNSARILTGFHVDRRQTWKASYQPHDHWTGHVRVLEFTAVNDDPDGRAVLEDYLNFLARDSFTATKLCRRLAVRFVSDTPSDELVAALAKVYHDNDTAIVPVLKAIVDSDEFKASVLQKVRTPVEDALATWNALRAEVSQPRHDHDAGNQFINVSKAIGQVVYDWPAPNGFPDVAGAWTSAGRILGSFRTHWYASGGYWPNQGITFPAVMDWMPDLPTQFRDVVEYVCAQVLYLPMTDTMLQAACAACVMDPQSLVDKDGALVKFKFPRLLVSLLDTPEHLCR